MNKKSGAAGVLCVIVCLSFCLISCKGSSYMQETELLSSDEPVIQETEEESADTPDSVSEGIYVHIAGAVANPGVYHLPDESRVYLAIEMAGGLTEDACADEMNQAALLSDGQMLVVLTKEEVQAQKEAAELKPSAGAKAADSSAGGLININTAAKEELMTLSGIGESKAAAIIEYRTTNGAFRRTEDIMNISGIKEGAYSKIKDSITVQ